MAMHVATGAMGSLLPKLGQLLMEEYKLHKRVKKDVEFLRKELESMHSALIKVGEVPRHQLDKQVKLWADEVRDLSYDMEDVVDKLLVRVDGIQPHDDANRFKGLMRRMIGVFKKGKNHHRIADAIKQIKEQLHEVAARRDRNKVVVPNPTEPIVIDPCLRALYAEATELVGIYGKRDQDLMRLLSMEGDDVSNKTLKKISIVGFGGLGKTTLARAIYDKIKGDFDCRAFVPVGQNPDAKKVLRDILIDLGNLHSDLAMLDANQLIKKLHEVLENKSAFQCLQGSRVMITRRREDVAALALERRRLLLQPLGSDESFKLFCSRAFHNTPDRKCPQELAKVAGDVVKRCLGLPLAIVSSGSLLSTKQPTQHAWNQMYNQLRSELQGNHHVQAILNLSYYDLPGDLRNCFLYCSLFPEDYAMSRENLVRLWVAEGFVIKKGNSTPEEVAEGSLMELIGRNMLEAVERDELFRVSSCKMHDIVRDPALAVAKEERFGSANDQGEMMLMDKEVRRFSTCGWTDSMAVAPGVEFPRLRTVISLSAALSSSNMISSVLSESSYLTVVELQDSAIEQVPAFIENLFNLRYLGLRGTKVQSLPDSIDKLSNLETLDVKQTKIEKLPPGIVKVKKLRHLLADRVADEKQKEFRYFVGVEAPNLISNFQQLQTLETVHASKDLPLQLEKMKKLRTIWIDNINASNCDDLFKTLSDMSLLSSLLLSACHDKETLSFQALKPVSKNLHRLIIRGCWADGTLNCPIFQGYGKNLKYLALSWCNLGNEDPLQLLASHLPALTYLSLNRVHSAGNLVLSAGCFSQLKTLVLKNMPDVMQLENKEGAIPCIDGIYIVSLSKLSMVPPGIESLGSLKKLWLLYLHNGFKNDWDQKEMDNKMKHVPELRA